ncbi:MAG TPA: AMP-binding protein [Methylomirabilota bacterium]
MTTTSPRPWHACWPIHVPRSIAYPSLPAWALLEASVQRSPRRVAIREVDHLTLAEGRVLTYEALFRATRGVAAGLGAAGVSPGARVGLVLPNSAALVIGFYALWYAGAVAVPVNPAARAPEVVRQFLDAGVSLVIGQAGGPGAAAARELRLPFIDMAALAWLEAKPPASPPAGQTPDDLAVILYTGGTTGVSKGVMLSHRTIVLNTLQFGTWYAFGPAEEVVVSAIPMFHAGGLSGVMNVPLSMGGTLLVFPRFAAPAVAHAVAAYRVTRLFGVPTIFIALLNDQAGRRADYSTLRACRTNATSLPVAVKEAFDALVGRPVLVEGYGLTEMTTLVHANPIERAKAGFIGIPLPDTDARVVDAVTGVEVPAGVAGELHVRGPQMMRGYWNRPRETADALCDGWLRTGDVAVMDHEGYFAIVGRTKDVINTAGFKVWPREVEEVLGTHPAVKMTLVVGVPDDYRGEAVKALVVLKDEWRGRVTADDIAEYGRARLTGYKAPRHVEVCDALPMNEVGKLLRRVATPPRQG